MTPLLNRKTPVKFKDLPTVYARLVALYPPRQIRNDKELEAATIIIDAMAGHELNADQDDYLDLISTLVSDYEDKHYPIRTKKLTPLEALKFIVEEAGLNAADLGQLLGNKEIGSKILRGERALSLNQIAILAEKFALSPEVFVPAAMNARKGGKPNAKRLWRKAAKAQLR